MGFQTLPVADKTDAGDLRGISCEVACGCWFTASGKIMPQIIRALDEEGCLHTIRVLEIISTTEKNFSGIETVEAVCRIAMRENKETFVKLIFTKKTCTWRIIFL